MGSVNKTGKPNLYHCIIELYFRQKCDNGRLWDVAVGSFGVLWASSWDDGYDFRGVRKMCDIMKGYRIS